MENNEILRLWKSYDSRLEEQLRFNQKAAAGITLLKVHALLNGMKSGKIALVLLGAVWVACGTWLLSVLVSTALSKVSVYFLCSATWQLLCTAVATGLYAYQLTMIASIGVSDPMLVAQQKLSRLQVATLWSLRILLLQLPAWCTFWWSDQFFAASATWQVLVAIVVAVLFALAAALLFMGLRLENREQRWFRFLFSGWEWAPVFRSQALLEEAMEIKSGETDETAH